MRARACLLRLVLVPTISVICLGLFRGSGYATPIDDKYTSLKAGGTDLGLPTQPEAVLPDGVGHFRVYAGGSIYWHPAIGAYEVHGLIRDKWGQLGWERGWLGYPVTDETNMEGGGRFNHF